MGDSSNCTNPGTLPTPGRVEPQKLRGHGLVAKIPRTRRYRVTAYGHRVMTAALAVHDRDFPAAYTAAAYTAAA